MTDPCANCGQREGTHTWVGSAGVLGFVHGWSAKWCERCVVAAQLEHAQKMAGQLPVLAARLAELEREP